MAAALFNPECRTSQRKLPVLAIALVVLPIASVANLSSILTKRQNPDHRHSSRTRSCASSLHHRTAKPIRSKERLPYAAFVLPSIARFVLESSYLPVIPDLIDPGGVFRCAPQGRAPPIAPLQYQAT
jgi:hypothetical protein